MRVSPHTAQAFQKAPLPGTRLKISNQGMSFCMAFRVYHHFLLTLFRRCIHLEASLGIDDIPADRTAAFLPPPDGQQLFPALCAVQHFLALAILKVIYPSLIEWIGFRNNFLETYTK